MKMLVYEVNKDEKQRRARRISDENYMPQWSLNESFKIRES